LANKPRRPRYRAESSAYKINNKIRINRFEKERPEHTNKKGIVLLHSRDQMYHEYHQKDKGKNSPMDKTSISLSLLCKQKRESRDDASNEWPMARP
jgi:hypothetical protein